MTVDPERKAIMIAMAQEGKTTAEISAAVGYKHSRSAGTQLRRWGVYLGDNIKLRRDKKRDEIRALYLAGKSARAIFRSGYADNRTIRAAIADIIRKPEPKAPVSAPVVQERVRVPMMVPKVQKLPTIKTEPPKRKLSFNPAIVARYLKQKGARA